MHITTHDLLNFWGSWLVMCVGMALLSGWRGLARRFAGGAERDGMRFRFASGSVSQWRLLPIQYHLSFFLTVYEQGFHLAVFFPVRLLHQPFSVPWSAVSQMRQEPFLLAFQQTVISLGEWKIRIRGRAGKALLTAWEGYCEQEK